MSETMKALVLRQHGGLENLELVTNHPKPKAKAAVVAAKAKAAGVPGPKTTVGFAPGSYWVAAAEIERLWSYTSHIKGNSGQLTVESWASKSEKDSVNLSKKRAQRVAQLLAKNTAPKAYKVNVKVHGASKSASRNVAVSFTSGSAKL